DGRGVDLAPSRRGRNELGARREGPDERFDERVLAARDTPLVWRAGAVTALGVVALHVFGGAAHYDPLAGAVGGSLAWAGVIAVFCAAAGAVLAGLALRNRQERSA
ncbi:hypothetical protein ABT106_24165, partial [Streptomyces sp. NPDC002044]